MNLSAPFANRIYSILPILEWLPKYQQVWLRPDVMAGLTLAAFTIPEAIAYAELAGLPPQSGLYASIAAPIIYLLFGTSKQLVIGPTSAVSILVASALGDLVLTFPGEYAILAATTALLIGAMAIIAYILRLGFLVNFISESVPIGFSSGAALYIASTQLSKLFGIHGAHGQFVERIIHLGQNIGHVNFYALLLSLTGIAVLILGEHKLRRWPWALIVVLGSIGLMSIGKLPELTGIKLVGVIPEGLPNITIPEIVLPDLRDLVRAAGAGFTLAYVEGMSMARAFATKNKYTVDANQELLALGLASIGAGLTQGYPVAGSFSRSALNDANRAKTQLASGISGLVIALVVLYLTDLFHNLPEPILAAIVIVAVRGLFKYSDLKRLYYLRKLEFWTAMTALTGVLVLGILDGVMIGALLSLVLMIARASQSRMSLLGRVPGQPQFADIEDNPENLTIPGLLMIRVDEGIFYANAESIKQQILELTETSEPPTQTIILDLEATYDLDVPGAEMLKELHHELSLQDIILRISRLQPSARALLDRAGITAIIGEDNIHPRTLYAVADYLTEEGIEQRISCDILPDLLRCVQDLVTARLDRLEGDERDKMEEIVRKLEDIRVELESVCYIA